MKLSSGSIEVHNSPNAADKTPTVSSSELVPIQTDENATLRSEIAELRLQLLASRDAVVGAEASAARARARAAELETQMHVRAVEVYTANKKADEVLQKLKAAEQEAEHEEEEQPDEEEQHAEKLEESPEELQLADVVVRGRAQLRAAAGRAARRALR